MHYVTSSHTWYDVTKYTQQVQGIFTEKVDFLKIIKLALTGFLHAPLHLMAAKILSAQQSRSHEWDVQLSYMSYGPRFPTYCTLFRASSVMTKFSQNCIFHPIYVNNVRLDGNST
jgi:hypothetical protein